MLGSQPSAVSNVIDQNRKTQVIDSCHDAFLVREDDCEIRANVDSRQRLNKHTEGYRRNGHAPSAAGPSVPPVEQNVPGSSVTWNNPLW